MAKRKMGLRPGETCDPGCMPGGRMSIQQRVDTSMSVVSAEVRDAMRREDAFIDSITGAPDRSRFTDRRAPPMRSDLIR